MQEKVDTADHLRSKLRKIDRRGYKAYKSVAGKYKFTDFILSIDHVQSDPFAPPSACSMLIPKTAAGFPEDLFCNPSRKTGFKDYLNRAFFLQVTKKSKRRGSGKSGLITILRPSQQVIERTSVRVVQDDIEVRFYLGLPAAGRKVLARQAEQMFFDDLPAIVAKSLRYKNHRYEKVLNHVTTVEDADFIRRNLPARGLVAFVSNGATLPRRSPVDDRPLPKSVSFITPASMEQTFECPNQKITGMGIKEGITLIVGGAYHGKSTLLNALARGVYNHLIGDGREFVITREDAVKIRAEDGRYVESVDISPFIGNLPNNIDTRKFSSEDASGSTSQAANICEALEIGSRLFLIDEDTSATNLMIRDRRIQELISREKEPITPMIDMIPAIRKKDGSIILIAGGLGAYFDVADTVIMMDSYKPYDVSGKAKKIGREFQSNRLQETSRKIVIRPRYPRSETVDPMVRNKIKVKARSLNTLQFGRRNVDLSRVEQLVELGQVKAIGDILYKVADRFNQKSLPEVLNELDGRFLSLLGPRGDYTQPRKYEVASVLNRLRGMKCK